MINFNQHLIEPIETALNNALETKVDGAYKYGVNNVPRNIRYQFSISSDTAEYEHATKEAEALHQLGVETINSIASINPVSLEGISANTYTALVDASVTMLLPLRYVRGITRNSFIGEFRRLVDETLQASQQRYVSADALYQVSTSYSLLQTSERAIKSSAGDSIEFTLYLEFGIVAFGVGSDNITLTIDGESVYAEVKGFARKSVKEMAIPAGSTSQKSYEQGTLFTINFDLPARLTKNATSQMTAKSFNEKVARFVLLGENPSFSVTVNYPTTETSGVISNTSATFTMKFDSVGINGQTGTSASQSVTLMEV